MSHYECEFQEEAEQAVMSVGEEREVEGMNEFRFAGQVPRLMRMQSTR